MIRKPTYEELELEIKRLEEGFIHLKQAEKKLLYREKMEVLVSDISSSFINVPSERIDDSINFSLQLVGEFAGVDRSYVFLFYEDGTKMDNTHGWCRQGIEAQIENLKGLSTEIFPWWMMKLRDRGHIHTDKIDDLPPEAKAEKEILQSQDIKSAIVVPLEYRDELVGFLGFDSVKQEKSWIEEDILLFKTIGDVFVSALKRKEAEEILARRLEFERLISEISSKFVGMSSDKIDEGIDNALAAIGAFSGADRAYMFLFDQEEELVDNTHEWCAEGVQPQKENLKNIPFVEKLPWFAEKIQKDEIFHVLDVADMPPEAHLEKEHFDVQDIKSLIVVPMRVGDHLVGFLGFDAVRERKTWTEYDQIILRLVGETFTNAIERKRSEMEHETLETRLANAIDLANLGPWEFDESGEKFICNDYFYKILGTTAEEMGGYTMSPDEYFSRFVHPEDLPLVEKEIRKVLDVTDPYFSAQHEHRILRADGAVRHVTVRWFCVKDRNGKILKTYGVNQDITERKQAEEMLRESEEKLTRSRKMESLGLLAGGVAHDLNNVLSGIISYPELLLLNLPKDSKFRKSIETIQESGNKAVAIVQDLLTIARGVVTTKEPLNLNDVVGEYLASPEFRRLEKFHPKVRVKTDLDSDLLNIRGSIVHIRKVIMNLVSNASEAIEGAGNVVISTRNRYLDRPIRGYEDANIGEYNVLTVSDDGSGISSDYLDRIFEPFFTKKMMGRSGTGLGLSVVWNIVQDHEGHIDVKSNENGTTFELCFPITRDEVRVGDLPISLEDLKGSGETVLVVDDIESQRDISRSMLEVLGYNPIAVSSGEDAVEYLKENIADLVLLDMIMDPGINGRETYKRIIKTNPAQKAILVSGFAETVDVKETLKLGAGQFINKPLTLVKIGVAIKKELSN